MLKDCSPLCWLVFISLYRRKDTGKVTESNESQTGSVFIPALSNHVTAGELISYPAFILQEHYTILWTFASSIVIIIIIINIQHWHHHHHPSSSSAKLTFKNVEIHLCSYHIFTAVLIKYNLSHFLQSFTSRYITWISPSVHLRLV